jgi:hypothetical protein
MDSDKQKLMLALGVDEATLMSMLRSVLPTAVRTAAKKSENGPVKLYKHVTKNCTCIHCGAKSVHSYNLSYGDSLIWQNPEGRVKQMIIRPTDSMEDITVSAFFPHCDQCCKFVSRMSRRELEERYFKVLCLVENGFKLVFEPAKEPIYEPPEAYFPDTDDYPRREDTIEEKTLRSFYQDGFDLDLLY